ncbi:hypothetical protein Droror1_Dr00002402 [Drosera rotundifolia]
MYNTLASAPCSPSFSRWRFPLSLLISPLNLLNRSPKSSILTSDAYAARLAGGDSTRIGPLWSILAVDLVVLLLESMRELVTLFSLSKGKADLNCCIPLQVDKGFVAQVADVVGGRTTPMNDEQREEAEKTVVGEFSEVKHVRGILSMGRARLNFSPLGACALAGTGLPIDRFMTSDALGFAAPLRNRYWDIIWTGQGVMREKGDLDRLSCTDFQVIVENEEQVEVSFTRRWNIGTRCFVVNYSFLM